MTTASVEKRHEIPACLLGQVWAKVDMLTDALVGKHACRVPELVRLGIRKPMAGGGSSPEDVAFINATIREFLR
jgi:hypothetical protein